MFGVVRCDAMPLLLSPSNMEKKRATSAKVKGRGIKPATVAAGPPSPAAKGTATPLHYTPTSRRQDEVDGT